nr:hypothetical protein [Gardnerella vaginalis]
MKSMLEHREDRFSPSLHLVGEWSIAHVCDGTSMLAKEACMQPTQQKQTLTPEHIARVRTARRAAVRRRRILVIALVVLTILVLLAGCSGLFTPVFALIPAIMLFVVLYLGARVSRRARKWEARVAAMRDEKNQVQTEDALYKHHNSALVYQLTDTNNAYDANADKASNSIDNGNNAADSGYGTVVDDSTAPVSSRSRDDAETSVMKQSEIRVALHQAMQERNAALRTREVSQEALSEDVDVNEDAYDVADSVPIVDSACVHQDLISFSLDAQAQTQSEKPSSTPSMPESLEIKSTKQVTKAVPVAKSTQAVLGIESSQSHTQESTSDVEAPESSADSLGVANLHDVLSRRSS